MRFWLRLAAPVAVMLLITVLSTMAGRSYSAASERSATYLYLSEALTRIETQSTAITWEEPLVPLLRPFGEADKIVIARMLGDAFSSYAMALALNDQSFLPDFMSGPALTRARMAVASGQGESGMAVLEQVVRPKFLHRDGSLLQLTIRARVLRYVLPQNPVEGVDGVAQAAAPFAELSDDDLLVTLENALTGWRIVSMERRAATPVVQHRPAENKPFPKRLAGINYYPSKTPWSTFWPNYDAAEVAADFKIIKGLGANTIRIFLTRDAFLNREGRAENLAALQSLLDLAEEHGLGVIPTLFDLKPSFAPGTWSEDVSYLRGVVPVLKDSAAVVFVDVKNQADLEDAQSGSALVDLWLGAMIATLRKDAPDLLLSVGWSVADHAARLAPSLNVISYTDYDPAPQTAERLAAVRAAVPGKPIVLSEIGSTSWSALFSMPSSPWVQADDLIQRIDQATDAAGVLVWTLHDFPTLDPKAIGGSPWAKRLQMHYGLYDETGAEKPSADAVRRAFDTYLKGSNP